MDCVAQEKGDRKQGLAGEGLGAEGMGKLDRSRAEMGQ